ncbi:MAG: hypothetical protein EA357_11620 [Micavibrio sp.]|nr:MAG: hypothetical protein EA357_11620 [Micavibrio sp.]
MRSLCGRSWFRIALLSVSLLSFNEAALNSHNLKQQEYDTMENTVSRKTKLLFVSAALITGMLCASPAFSDSIVRETVTTTRDGKTVQRTVTTETPGTTILRSNGKEYVHTPGGIHVVEFIDFDLNKDGIMSTHEVGEMLFKLYDTDGNNVIDNMEYNRPLIITVKPVEHHTTIYYDLNGNGKADEVVHTYETFKQDTRLADFVTNKDGLSARDFTNLHFNEVDVNGDGMIDLEEWQGTYIPSVDRANKERARFNR